VMSGVAAKAKKPPIALPPDSTAMLETK
jgi:hypothetical protein